MAKIDVFDVKNSIVGSVDLHDAILDYPVNTVLIHEVVKMRLACRRAGTHATKTKGLVSVVAESRGNKKELAELELVLQGLHYGEAVAQYLTTAKRLFLFYA